MRAPLQVGRGIQIPIAHGQSNFKEQQQGPLDLQSHGQQTPNRPIPLLPRCEALCDSGTAEAGRQKPTHFQYRHGTAQPRPGIPTTPRSSHCNRNPFRSRKGVVHLYGGIPTASAVNTAGVWNWARPLGGVPRYIKATRRSPLACLFGESRSSSGIWN